MSKSQLPSLIISTAVHGIAVVVMAMITLANPPEDESFVIDTVVADEERDIQEFVQELDTQQEVSETLNLTPGSVSTEVGGSEGPLSQQEKIETEDVVKDPELQVNMGVQNVPAMNTLGDDLGESEVTGEVGAVVEGYGAALDRLTGELLRMMRDKKLLVVWMFDESESMRDDQQEIKQRIYRVYEELKIVERDAKALGGRTRRLDEVLLTAITSFGAGVHVHTKRPTTEIPELQEAIDKIPEDKTGAENLFQSMREIIKKYRGVARSDRKLVVVVVSDESGDDGMFVEEAIHEAQSANAPVYIMGRESVFGNLYAYVRWKQPETGHVFKLPIRRGPETPFAECLQWDGFRKRQDSHMSGFGPYEQVRVCRNTGGIFFQLPHEQQNLNDYDDRKFDMIALKEYLPDLSSRREYAAIRDRSPFRKAIWDVIVMLNPHDDGKKEALNIPEQEHFSVNWAQSQQRVGARIKQIVGMLNALTLAQQRLEKVKPLRAREASQRWRANFDLMYAQLFAYRVRLFEYALALDQYGKTMPQRIPKTNPPHNRWRIRTGDDKLIMPDEAQQQFFKITPDDIKQAYQKSLELFAEVKKNHPGTPWSRRAEWEEKRKFGANFASWYSAPPKPRPKNAKPRPKPTPPPKL